MPDDFKKLPEERKIKMQATPMLASVHWIFEDDSDEDIERWFEEFNKLDLPIRYGLDDEKVAQAILNFAKKYNLYNKEYIGEISRIIREVYTRMIKEEEIKRRMIEKLNVRPGVIDLIIQDLKQIIITVKEAGAMEKKKGEQEEKEKYDYLDINAAIKAYPKILEQLISFSRLWLEIYEQTVRPSVKNWLEDYKEKAGAGSHTSMQRNHYLFDTDNARVLSAEERQRLADLVESYDENKKLLVNKVDGSIEFKKRDLLNEGVEMERQQVNMQSETENNFEKKESQAKERKLINQEDKTNGNWETDIQDLNDEKNEQNEDKNRNILDLSNY